ncbi:hypothetical protein NEICINOT_03506 [Neisseria cinerea ATCC 14685]|uniref:Uncharacterized protein n=1 Tax=Neisseria cinerea ATCC 14685 TaxID=546262 RepID=D0W1I3_NEICI|nr:hypothetical protein NEICINOT_03506 [Neisseria cinerea ATCC 14685]
MQAHAVGRLAPQIGDYDTSFSCILPACLSRKTCPTNRGLRLGFERSFYANLEVGRLAPQIGDYDQ